MPFVLAAGLVGLLLWRIDFHAFVLHLKSVNYLFFLPACVLFMVVLLAADSLATSFVYSRTVCPISFRELFLIRAASYLPSMLNHHVGQAWLTWYLSRVYQAPLSRTAGATLLVYATTFGSLFLFLLVSLFFPHNQADWIGPTLAIIAVAGVAYLGVIFKAPPSLAKRQLLAPLFDVGVRGHLEALALRLPHMIVLFVGSWFPFHFFHIELPPGAAFAYVPVLMVVAALPITPQGVGTRDWFSVQAFSQFAPGSTADEQAAAVTAATLTFAAAITLFQAIFSLIMMQRALRVLARKKPPQ